MWSLEKILEKLNELQKLGGLRFMILHVLDDGSKNGAEIMDSIQSHREQIEEMLSPHPDAEHLVKAFKPSPGAVYPLLKKLVSECLIIKREDGRYELTKTGRNTINILFGRLHHSLDKPMDRGVIAIDTALNEIDSYISFLNCIKKDKLQSKKEKIEDLTGKLTELKNSL